jgi:hypothetical protein
MNGVVEADDVVAERSVVRPELDHSREVKLYLGEETRLAPTKCE